MTNVPAPGSVIPTEEIRNLLQPHPRAITLHHEVENYFGSSLRFEWAGQLAKMSVTDIRWNTPDTLDFGGISIRLKHLPDLAASITHELFHARYVARGGAVPWRPVLDGLKIDNYIQLANMAQHEAFVGEFQAIFPLDKFMRQDSPPINLQWYRLDIKRQLSRGITKEALRPDWYQIYMTHRIAHRHGLMGRSEIADEMIAWPESPWPELKQEAEQFRLWITRGETLDWRNSSDAKDHFTCLTNLCGLPPVRFYKLEADKMRAVEV